MDYPPRTEPAANPAAAARARFGIAGMTTVVTTREAATLALVPGVTTAPSICIVEERHPPGGGAEGSANLPAKSLTVCMVADRHSPETLRVQDIAARYN